MFDTTLLVRCNWYILTNRKGTQRIQYRYSDNNLRGDQTFVFRTERGADKTISQAIVQLQLKEETVAPSPAKK